MSNKPYIIAEVAQGYEGDAGVANLLVRAAAAGKANAIKFQIIYADDLSEPGYQYRDLFEALEMSEAIWRSIAEQSRKLGMAFIADVFGPQSMKVAAAINADGYKIHSTSFFDDALVGAVLAQGKPVYLSVGGIEPDEITAFIARHNLKARKDIAILFGYQAEPTPIAGNNLGRMEELRRLTDLEVGFMDHSDGDGPDWLTLSTVALGLGVRIFEKHITLDRGLKMEDYVSALEPVRFQVYTESLHRLSEAFGSSSLSLSEAEQGYRGRALKRVVTQRALPAGHVLAATDLRLSRPAEPKGLYKIGEAVGRKLRHDLAAGMPVDAEVLA